MKVKIYQKQDPDFFDFGELTEDFTIDNYNCIYECEMESTVTLDDIYEAFNIRRPADFYGHSLSVGDIIEIPDGRFYVNNFGFQKV